mgnify:FL=1
MKPYELVLVLQASLSAEAKKEVLDSVESLIGGSDVIKQKDDAGIVPAAYALGGKKDMTHINIVSYYIHIQPSSIKKCTQGFAFLKGLVRHFFYSMGANQVFMTFADVQKALTETLPVVEKKK